MDLTINVQFSATKELQDTLSAVAGAVVCAIERNTKAMEQLPFDNPAPAPKATDTAQPEEMPITTHPFGETAKEQDVKVEAAAQESAPTPEKKAEIGVVEIRAAMMKARKRIEYPAGEEEADASLHKQMNACFKAIATRIDAGKKPTELTGVYAEQFVDACEGIILIDGKVCPFKEEEDK